jgi:hypothetical protein
MKAHKILYKCKICGREGVAEAALECPPEWIDKLVGGLCCNICYDARERRLEAEKWIFKACHLLLHADKFKDPKTTRDGALKILEESVPVFAEAVCAAQRLQTVLDPDFLSGFMRKPENAGARMAAYKHGIEEIARTNSMADSI